MNSIANIVLFSLSDPNSPTGTSPALIKTGGNPNLSPETSISYSVGLDLKPSAIPGLRLSGTYSRIDYKDRLASLADFTTALTDPANSAFVVRNPSASEQATAIAAAANSVEEMNYTGSPYNPSTVVAIVDYRLQNIARQKVDAVDLQFDYSPPNAEWISVFGNATYLHIKQQASPSAPSKVTTGLVFNPPSFRARGGFTLKHGDFAGTVIANYTGKLINEYTPQFRDVHAETTLDLTVQYTPNEASVLRGIDISLSVQNIFNTKPPLVVYNVNRANLNYDSFNYSPLGRFVTFQISKRW
jgi:outer membrane receptor protein involved in Fe transport